MAADTNESEVWPIWRYILMIALISGSYVAYAWAFDLPILAGDSESIVPVQTGMWAAVMTGCLAALGHWTAHATELRVFRILGDLPFLPESGGIDEIKSEWAAKSTEPALNARARRMEIGGAVSGLLFAVLAIAMTIDAVSITERFIFAGWYIVVLPYLFAYVTKHVYRNIVGSRFILERAAALTEIDILRPQRQIAFARLALRNGLGWIVALTVTLLLTLGDQVSKPGMIPLFLGTGLMAVQSFWGPMRVIHNKLTQIKNDELERLSTLIATARHELEKGNDAAGSRLSGLIAWRQAVHDAREWPTDTGTVLRLFLYLAIPVGGWVGAAFVEALLEPLF